MIRRTEADIEKMLADAGLTGWEIDLCLGGEIQFFTTEVVSFNDLNKLKTTFAPVHMHLYAAIDDEKNVKLAVEMSWGQFE